MKTQNGVAVLHGWDYVYDTVLTARITDLSSLPSIVGSQSLEHSAGWRLLQSFGV